MPRVSISRCGRCGQIRSGKGWFTNDQGQDCHTCKDGIIGGMVQADVKAVIDLATPPIKWNALVHCPICGVPWSESNRQKATRYDGQPIFLKGGYRYCASCCIADTSTRRNDDPTLVIYKLLDIHDFYPPGNAGEVERKSELSRVARHIAWVRSLTGLDIEPERVARAIAFSETSYKKLVGQVRHERSIQKITCGHESEKGHVYQNATMMVRTVDSHVTLRSLRTLNSSRAALISVRSPLRLKCPTCGRMDWYLKREMFGVGTKWIWFYTTLKGIHGQLAACDRSRSLTKEQKASARPMAIVANDPAGTVPAPQSFADEVKVIAEKLGKILSNQ